MDDPWGSPWADETSHPLPKTDKSGPKELASSDKSIALNETGGSPWADVDNFGEWAPLPAIDDLQNSVQEGPEEAETVESVDFVDNSTFQEKDHIRPDGSTWFSREIQQSNSDISTLEISKSTEEGLSPDPWAVEAMKLDDGRTASEALETIPGGASRSNNSDEKPALDGMSDTGDEETPNTQDKNDFERSRPPPHGKGQPTLKSLTNAGKDVPASDSDGDTKVLNTEEAAHGESVTSRPSSSPSDHSHHDEVLTESPRTSFEDEVKRPNVELEGASKVKKMVRLFEGLATECAVTELAGQSEYHDDQFHTPAAVQSDDDFGDFEEGTSEVTTEASSINGVPKEEPAQPADKVETRGTSDGSTDAEGSEITSTEHHIKPNDLFSFEPDLSLISRIFGQISEDEFTPADPKRVAEVDGVIQGSFSSTEERKIWYRISRQGTTRKHNAGDEDYVRVNWKDSKVRIETLNVVERWIEEDRISGGPILGGGIRLGSMFGWGQKNAAPMSVAAALASKGAKKVIHSDHTELPIDGGSNAAVFPNTSFNRKSSDQTPAARNPTLSPSSATAPQFSWSSGTSVSAMTRVTSPVSLPSVSSNTHHQKFTHVPSCPQALRGTPSTSPTMLKPTLASIGSSSVQQSNLNPSTFTRFLEHSDNQNVSEALPKGLSSRINNGESEMVSSLPISTSSAEDLKKSRVMNIPSPGSAILPHSEGSNHATDSQYTEEMTVARLNSAKNHASILPTAPSPTPKPDAWAAVDFSFFDSSPPPKLTPAPPPSTPKATIPSAAFAMQSSGIPSIGTEQDRIVKSIILSLPNISYMLR